MSPKRRVIPYTKLSAGSWKNRPMREKMGTSIGSMTMGKFRIAHILSNHKDLRDAKWHQVG